jgi:hypothetical protein
VPVDGQGEVGFTSGTLEFLVGVAVVDGVKR